MPSRWLCWYGPYSPPASGPSSQSRPSQRSVPSAEPMYSSVTRDWSVSSIRRTNTPPVWRAKAQSYSAVLMLPTCRSPLGDGAKRTRTRSLSFSVTVNHPVAERSDALDRDGYLVAVGQRPDAGRGAGQQHVAGQQRHHGADVADQLGHVVQQLRRPRVLLDLTVHRRAQLQVSRVQVGLDPRAERAERVEPLGPGPLAVPGLEIPGGDVVGAGVAEDDLRHPLGGHVPAEPADHDGQLALEIDPLGQLDRAGHRVARPGHRRGRLQDDDRLGGRLAAHLPRVVD